MSKVTRKNPKKIKNGWYEYVPFAETSGPMGLHQIVQVIEGDVWLTGVSMSESWTVKQAKYKGQFVRRIPLGTLTEIKQQEHI